MTAHAFRVVDRPIGVRVYAEAADARIGHLRTKNTHHEIDLIVEAADRCTIAIEVKLTDTIRPAEGESHWEEVDCRSLVHLPMRRGGHMDYAGPPRQQLWCLAVGDE